MNSEENEDIITDAVVAVTFIPSAIRKVWTAMLSAQKDIPVSLKHFEYI